MGAALLVLITLAGTASALAPFTWSPRAITIDGGDPLIAVACPSSDRCITLDSVEWAVDFNPLTPSERSVDDLNPSRSVLTTGPWLLACPSRHQCTTVGFGGSVTFSPGARSRAMMVPLASAPGDNAISGLACPSVAQCTVIWQGGQAQTYNPAKGAMSSLVPLTSGAGIALYGLSCPSTTQCTAVGVHGDAGNLTGEEVTFNPRSPGAPQPHVIDLGGALSNLACPSSHQCTAIDSSGRQVTFDPTAPHPQVPRTVDPTTIYDTPLIQSLACPSTSWCIVVDRYGYAIEGNPRSTRAWRRARLGFGDALNGVACPTPSRCVAVDSTGQVLVGQRANANGA